MTAVTGRFWQILADFGKIWQILSNFRRSVLGCIDSYDSENRRILQLFSRSARLAYFCTAPHAVFSKIPAEFAEILLFKINLQQLLQKSINYRKFNFVKTFTKKKTKVSPYIFRRMPSPHRVCLATCRQADMSELI